MAGIYAGHFFGYTMRIDRQFLLSLLVPFFLLTVVFLLYKPGVTGPFLLDDPIHFQKLAGSDGEIDTTAEVLELVGSGSSATGRPLSFLSLLIDDNAWPAPPLEFKLTNVLFHVLNALLVFWLAYRLLVLLPRYSSKESIFLGATIALIWAIAPIQVSSVFMTIQRMTLLAGTMSLVALILLTYAWNQHQRPKATVLIFCAGFVAVVGLLFKETAISIVFYAACIGFLIKQLRGDNPHLYRLAVAFSVLVVLMLISYYVLNVSRMSELYAKRTFTMTERLLTEGRIIVDYLAQIFLPRMSESGAFHDDYPVSRNLFHPLSTFFCWLFLIATIVIGTLLRKRVPLLFFGVAWFIAGHFLESTFLPLELYFEHRNYLPSLGLWIALVVGVYHFLRIKGTALVFAPYLLLLAIVTFGSTTTWGQPGVLFHVWLQDNPQSLRARIEVVRYELEQGRFSEAKRIFLEGQDYIKRDAGYYLYGFIVDRCNNFNERFIDYDLEGLLEVIDRARFEHASLEGLNWLTERIGTDRCNLQLNELESITSRYLQTEAFTQVTGARISIENNMAKLATKQGNLDKAISYLESNYQLSKDVGYLLNAAYLLASAGLFESAELFLDRSEAIIGSSINPFEKRKNEIQLGDVRNALGVFKAQESKIKEVN
ncbi:tetratricopeptide repeat protein [Marinobacter sp. DUT-3]|uniref:tetratricopeptide repeat protein n=1 Tax=Marinobacter sp. DUT-3 TaxID=3412036 RepID=UPI003D1656A6